MAMRKFEDLIATTGVWSDTNGKPHKRRAHCGVIIKDDKSGRMTACVELLPIASDWSGWLSVVQTTDDEAPRDVCSD